MIDTVLTNEINVEFSGDPVRLYRWVIEDRKNSDEWTDKKNRLAGLYKKHPVFAIHGTKSEIWIASKSSGFERDLANVSGEISKIRGGTEALFDVDPENTLKLLINLMFSGWADKDELIEEAALFIEEKGTKEFGGIEYSKYSFIKADVKEEHGRLLLIPTIRSYYSKPDDPEGRMIRTISSNKNHALVRRIGKKGDPVLVSVKGDQNERYVFSALCFSDVMEDKVKFFHKIISSMNDFYEGSVSISPVSITGNREHRDHDSKDREYIETAREILKCAPIRIDDRLTREHDLIGPVRKSIERVCASSYTGTAPVLSGEVKIRCDDLLCIYIPKSGYFYPENGIATIDSELLLTKPKDEDRRNGKTIRIFTKRIQEKISVSFSSDTEHHEAIFRYSGGYGITPKFSDDHGITVSMINSEKASSDTAYFAAKDEFPVVQHITRFTAGKIARGQDSITEKILSELMIKSDIRDRVIRCYNADDCCGWSFMLCNGSRTDVITPVNYPPLRR